MIYLVILYFIFGFLFMVIELELSQTSLKQSDKPVKLAAIIIILLIIFWPIFEIIEVISILKEDL